MFRHFQYYELEGLLQHMVMNIEVISLNQFSSGIVRRCIETYGDYVAVPMIH